MDNYGSSRLVIRACASQLRTLREWVSRQVAGTALTVPQVEDLLGAVDEAAANAIRHGSPDGCLGEVRVVCRRDKGGVTVDVWDEGSGFAVPVSPPMPHPEATSGRGLPLIYALADDVEIAATKGGTRVTIVKTA